MQFAQNDVVSAVCLLKLECRELNLMPTWMIHVCSYVLNETGASWIVFANLMFETAERIWFLSGRHLTAICCCEKLLSTVVEWISMIWSSANANLMQSAGWELHAECLCSQIVHDWSFIAASRCTQMSSKKRWWLHVLCSVRQRTDETTASMKEWLPANVHHSRSAFHVFAVFAVSDSLAEQTKEFGDCLLWNV